MKTLGPTCRAAIALAMEVGGPTARVLVLGDHPPSMALDGGQVQWWAFGEKLPNMAFTAATRTRFGRNRTRALEVTNLSDSRGEPFDHGSRNQARSSRRATSGTGRRRPPSSSF